MNENKTVQLAAIYPLSEDERLEARNRAEQIVIRKHAGTEPQPEQFKTEAISEYPNSFYYGLLGMMLLAFLGSFATSAFSVFSAGRDHFVTSMPSGAGVEWQAVIVGLAVVLLAEFLTIASVLVARILLAGRWVWQLIMMIPTLLGVVIAITANAVIAQPVGFWPWLVTVAPPASVVFLSIILEQLTLAEIRRRHESRKAYVEAKHEWQYLTREPQNLAIWVPTYANVLRAAIRDKNSRGRGRDERIAIMQSLGRAEWSALIHRELDADQWLMSKDELEAIPANPTQPQPALLLPSRNGHGHGAGRANGNNAQSVGSVSERA